MTDIKDQIDPLVLADAALSWDRKEHLSATVDHGDISPSVAFYRDGRLVMAGICARVDRDMALTLALMCAQIVQANLVVLHVDAHMAKVLNNPLTGEPWKSGEMQKACDEEGMCMTDILTDCITTIAVWKDGRLQQYSRPYHGHEKAGGLIWDDDQAGGFVDGGSAEASGLVVDTLRRCWERPSDMDTPMIRASLGDQATGSEEGDRLLMAASMAVLTGAAAAVMVGSDDPQVAQLVRDRMQDESLADSDLGAMLYVKGVYSGFIEDPELLDLIRQHGPARVTAMVLDHTVETGSTTTVEATMGTAT